MTPIQRVVTIVREIVIVLIVVGCVAGILTVWLEQDATTSSFDSDVTPIATPANDALYFGHL